MKRLTPGQKFSVFYHDLFNYPLNEEELVKWAFSGHYRQFKGGIVCKEGFYTLKGHEYFIKERKARKDESLKKAKIASKAAKICSLLPSIRLVAVSGSLAMMNASKESDIDLLFITSKSTLWITRPLVYLLLKLNSFELRKPNDPNEKDKLCLNLWMDEADLAVREKNLYTAHELAQLKLLINKDNIYEQLIQENIWIAKYWPNAVPKIEPQSERKDPREKYYLSLLKLINKSLYCLQLTYMKGKMTREQVSLTRAFFTPKIGSQRYKID